jgi:NitT/TauT family transport system substrate-binding protein
MFDRRTFLGATAAAATAAALPRPASALELLRVLSVPVEIGCQLDYGAPRGFAEASGLTLDVQYLNNGAITISTVVSGAAEIATTTMITAISAHQKNIPVSIIAPGALYSTKVPTTVLMVSKDATYQNARDLAGKTIGVDALKNITQIAVANWLDKNGGDSKGVHFIEMPFADMPGALATKRIDAAYIAEPAATRARTDSRVLAACYDAIAPTFLLGAWVARNDWIAAHPDIVKRFATVVQKCAAYSNANHEATLPILERITKIDPSVAAQMPRTAYAERLDPALIKPVIDVGVKYGIIDVGLRPEELIAPLMR